MSEASTRITRILAVLCILGIALWWRLPQTPEERELIWFNNDTIYQFHLIQECLNNYPQVPSIDHFSHFPEGYRLHWLPAHTFFYATIAKITGHRPEAVVSLVPPILGLAAFALAMAIARLATSKDSAWIICGLLCAFCTIRFDPFYYGLIDHHMFSYLGIVLAAFGALKRHVYYWAIGITIALTTDPAAYFYVSLLLVVLFLSHLCSTTGRTPWSYFWTAPAAALFSLLVNRLPAEQTIPFLHITPGYFSHFHVLWFLFLAQFCTGVIHFRDAISAGRRRAAALFAATATVTAIIGGTLLLASHWEFFAQRLMRSGRLVVNEEKPVLGLDFFHAPIWIWLLFLTGPFFVYKIWQNKKNGAPPHEYFKWWLFLAALTVGLSEQRHMYVFIGIVSAGAATAWVETVHWLRSKLPAFAPWRWVPAVFFLVVITPSFYSANINGRTRILREHSEDLGQKRTVAEWLRNHTPDPAIEPYGVFAPWGFGHHINILGRRPVTADPFNFPSTTEDTLKSIWWATSTDELTSDLEELNVRYLVVVEPVMQIFNLMSLEQLNEKNLLSDPQEGTLYYRPEIMQYAVMRLFFSEGQDKEFQQRFMLRFASSDKHTFLVLTPDGLFSKYQVSGIQIYEVRKSPDFDSL